MTVLQVTLTTTAKSRESHARVEVNNFWLIAATGVDSLAILFRPKP